MKPRRIFILSLILSLLVCNYVYAAPSIVNLSTEEESHSQDINITTNMDGSFADLSYQISSTGATAGIRYRTSAIKINIGSYTATINILDLENFKPAPGATVYSVVTVDAQDIIDVIGQSHSAEILSLLSDPAKNVSIGANIQIYNPGTGEVLDTIYNENDLDSIASQYGFGQTDINDMESRYQDKIGQPIESIEPTQPKSNGLRPSILVE